MPDAAVAALAVAVAGLLAVTAAAVPATAVAAAAVLLLLAPAAAAACVRLLCLLPAATGLYRHGMRPGRAGSSPGGTACSQRRSGTAGMQESAGKQAGSEWVGCPALRAVMPPAADTCLVLHTLHASSPCLHSAARSLHPAPLPRLDTTPTPACTARK